MIITVHDILKLPRLKQLQLVAGEKGLNRVLYRTHVADFSNMIEWVQAGELIFITGIGIYKNLEQLPQVIKECHRKDVAGLIINTGPYIQHTPKETIEVANELAFPIFEAPWETRLANIIQIIHNFIDKRYLETESLKNMFETILYGEPPQPELIARAAALNYDLTKIFQIVIISFKNFEVYFRDVRGFNDPQIQVAKLKIKNSIQDIFKSYRKKILFLIRLDDLIIMLPTLKTQTEKEITEKIIQEILEKIQLEFEGLILQVGCGKPYSIQDQRKSLLQASQAIKAIQIVPNRNYINFDELGFYKVLFSVKERSVLVEFRNDVLGILLEHDKKHGSKLVHTLAVLFEEDNNCIRTSERLFIHRNTLKYRLNKIMELLGRNLSDYQDRQLLHFALSIHNFLKMQ